ncbi:MAG: phage late control D family protein [Calditrichaeota bacterium]|nr:phage late control D family protein [Calditrichota bacterium]
MSLTLVELEKSKAYHQFYAPFAKVLLEGKDLLKMGLEVISVSVDNTLEGMDQFSFVINNVFDVQNREFIEKQPNYTRLDKLFQFGKKVEIFMGYLDKLKPMLTGIITSFRTSYPAGGLPQITISGYDLSYCMSKGKKSRKPWNDMKDSDVVTEIAGKYGLKAVVEDSQVVHPRIEQSQETDRHFLEKLAGRNGFELYVRGKKLYFKPSANSKNSILTLEWGAGLISFSPEINLAEQITKVEVTGWNINTKKEIIGKAQINDEPGMDPKRKSGGEYLKAVCQKGDAPIHRIRLPIYTQQHADQRAKAILKKLSEGFVKGSGESLGIPELLPDNNITLKGLGTMFNKTYYIEKTTHTFNSSGYKTTFHVKDTTI